MVCDIAKGINMYFSIMNAVKNFPIVKYICFELPHAMLKFHWKSWEIPLGYNVFNRPSVSQSVRPVFLISTTQLKPLNKISWNFVVIKDKVTQFFFNLEIWPKWKILLKQCVSATPLKWLNRTSWNFVVTKDIICRCANPQEILILFFFSRNYALFELRNLTKMKDTNETVCQRNSSKVAQQNSLTLCSYEGHNV